MNRDQIEGGWKRFCGDWLERWSDLMDDESGAIEARDLQLAGNIQMRQGCSEENLARTLREFMDRNRRWEGGASPQHARHSPELP